MPDNGTIDITNLVENSRSTFVTWATQIVMEYIVSIPGLQWVAFPLIKGISKFLLSKIFNYISNQAVMLAFFQNTAITKASEASKYVDAINAKLNLPVDASDADYERAEQNEISAFNSFVTLTS